MPCLPNPSPYTSIPNLAPSHGFIPHPFAFILLEQPLPAHVRRTWYDSSAAVEQHRTRIQQYAVID
jgi:hypothetical protein